MDTRLHGGDHARGYWGAPVAADGTEELIQRCVIRLCVPRGSFDLDKNLGSRLHTLPRGTPGYIQDLAEQYINEAFEEMPYVTVTGVLCSYNPEKDRLTVTVGLDLRGQSYKMEVMI